MNRIAELRRKLGLTQAKLGEKIGVSQQTISKYENADENISPVDFILKKEESEKQKECDNRKEIMDLYKDLNQYNRDTWIIIGKRLLGAQLHMYNENEIIKKTRKYFN